MELILLLSLMTAFASAASLDAELCGEGESFWCQSLANAKTCRAVDHCKETVWKNMNLEECKELIGEETHLQIGDSEMALRMTCCSLGICNRDAILEPRESLPLEMKQTEWSLSEASPPEKCPVCQQFFSSVQGRLKTSDTQASLLNVLRVEICSLAPAVNTDMCMRAVGSTLPLILKLSLQFYDHKTICQQLTMCPLAEDDLDQQNIDWNMLHFPLIDDKNKTLSCNICEKVFDFIPKIKNISIVIEKTILTFFCQDIFPFQMVCKGVVKFLAQHIADDVVNWLYKGRFEFCRVLQFCDDSNNSISLSQHQQQQQQLQAAKKPNEETTVCQLCLQVLQTTIGSEAVNQTEDHKTICQQLTMCPLAADDLNQFDNHERLIEDQEKVPNCTDCYKVFDFITKKLDISVVIEDTIRTYICKYIHPYRSRMLCKGIAKLVAPRIAENLNSWLEVRQFNICEFLQLCHDSKNSASLSMQLQYQQLLAAKKPVEETTVCQLCLQVFKTIIESDAVNRTEMTILNAMRQTCDSLWWPYGSQCHRMVDAVGGVALQKLSQRLHPEGACQMLGFCDGASDVHIIHDIVETVASERCSYCQSTAEYLAVLLGQERAVNEIQSQMKRICGFHPFGMDKEECESFVDKYIPMFVDYLSEDLSQDNVCQRASLCTGLNSNRGSGTTMAAIPPEILDLFPQFKCLYGSQFWCATVDNAKLCQMEQYCGRESS